VLLTADSQLTVFGYATEPIYSAVWSDPTIKLGGSLCAFARFWSPVL
jgi:hypothetical protein